jgi:hypothetical protein
MLTSITAVEADETSVKFVTRDCAVTIAEGESDEQFEFHFEPIADTKKIETDEDRFNAATEMQMDMWTAIGSSGLDPKTDDFKLIVEVLGAISASIMRVHGFSEEQYVLIMGGIFKKAVLAAAQATPVS